MVMMLVMMLVMWEIIVFDFTGGHMVTIGYGSAVRVDGVMVRMVVQVMVIQVVVGGRGGESGEEGSRGTAVPVHMVTGRVQPVARGVEELRCGSHSGSGDGDGSGRIDADGG